MFCNLFYSVLCVLYKGIICNSFLNIVVIVALIYKVVIVALIREKRKKKNSKHEGERQHLDIHISTYM